ncbi:MAG: hypothetical protein ACR2KG_00800 [Nocardioidaceae bacterium]
MSPDSSAMEGCGVQTGDHRETHRCCTEQTYLQRAAGSAGQDRATAEIALGVFMRRGKLPECDEVT